MFVCTYNFFLKFKYPKFVKNLFYKYADPLPSKTILSHLVIPVTGADI